MKFNLSKNDSLQVIFYWVLDSLCEKKINYGNNWSLGDVSCSKEHLDLPLAVARGTSNETPPRAIYSDWVSGEPDYFWLSVPSWVEASGFPIQSMSDELELPIHNGPWTSYPNLSAASAWTDRCSWMTRGSSCQTLLSQFPSPRSDPVILHCTDKISISSIDVI